MGCDNNWTGETFFCRENRRHLPIFFFLIICILYFRLYLSLTVDILSQLHIYIERRNNNNNIILASFYYYYYIFQFEIFTHDSMHLNQDIYCLKFPFFAASLFRLDGRNSQSPPFNLLSFKFKKCSHGWMFQSPTF